MTNLYSKYTFFCFFLIVYQLSNLYFGPWAWEARAWVVMLVLLKFRLKVFQVVTQQNTIKPTFGIKQKYAN